jgi:hypothetical protein
VAQAQVWFGKWAVDPDTQVKYCKPHPTIRECMGVGLPLVGHRAFSIPGPIRSLMERKTGVAE